MGTVIFFIMFLWEKDVLKIQVYFFFDKYETWVPFLINFKKRLKFGVILKAHENVDG